LRNRHNGKIARRSGSDVVTSWTISPQSPWQHSAARQPIGAGALSLRIAGFTLDGIGIGTAAYGAILLYHQLWRDTPDG